MTKFFFYGIFLRRAVREGYGITDDPAYDTVADYATFGGHIVEAVKIPNTGLSLSGIVVEVPDSSIPAIDQLEAGYDRITVRTINGVVVQMYVAPGRIPHV